MNSIFATKEMFDERQRWRFQNLDAATKDVDFSVRVAEGNVGEHRKERPQTRPIRSPSNARTAA
ncbi:hypothetical protein EPN29_07895 [bacterium]|nr:MAG: hypothetical protein EPN29_07895 [bacterium]